MMMLLWRLVCVVGVGAGIYSGSRFALASAAMTALTLLLPQVQVKK